MDGRDAPHKGFWPKLAHADEFIRDHAPRMGVVTALLYRLMAGKTAIAIAHRLSTIAAMDRLVVLDRGRLSKPARTRSCLLRTVSTPHCGAGSPAASSGWKIRHRRRS